MNTLCIGLLADGAPWEAESLRLVEATPRMIVLKRSVDLDDLLASATTGQLQVAVLAAEVSGLDAAAVQHLVRHGVTPVAVTGAGPDEGVRDRLGQIGVRTVLRAADVAELPAVLKALGESTGVAPARPAAPGRTPEDLDEPAAVQEGHVLVVWGPVGAPGRTSVATGIAGLLARRGRPVIVVDADPHASVAQHLGVLDQVSGLLSAARLHTAGTLPGRVQSVCRALTARLGVLTGLPRPERREEVAAGVVVDVVDEIARFADVVVDLGSDLDADALPGAAGVWSIDLLERADEVLVVGAADPVGLTRLAHALVDLREACPGLGFRVVVNRTRSSLGWSEKEMSDVVARHVPVGAVHFLPWDQAALDRAVIEGEPCTDRDSRFARALGAVLDAVRPETVQTSQVPGPRGATRGVLRRRTAGTARPR